MALLAASVVAALGDRTVAKAQLTILCSIPSGAQREDLHLDSLHERYGHAIRCELSTPAVAARRCGSWVSPAVPSLVLLRAGAIVGLAVGRLSRREVELLVERAMDGGPDRR